MVSSTKLLFEIEEKVVHGNLHDTIDPKGLRHGVGNASVPQSERGNGLMAVPDCMQTGMHAKAALIRLKRQLSGLERPQNSVIGSCKTVPIVRCEDESKAKVRTPDASARGVCQLLLRGTLFQLKESYHPFVFLLIISTVGNLHSKLDVAFSKLQKIYPVERRAVT